MWRWLTVVALAGCSAEFGFKAQQVDLDAPPADDLVVEPPVDEGGEVPVEPTVDTDVSEDTAAPVPVDTGPLCDPTTEWVQTTFTYPPDALSCAGDQFIHYEPRAGLWVGVVSCGGTAYRIYLSESESGEYLPAMDTAGHGQDHCELLDPTFTIPNEDDITSGGCAACSTSRNLPLEGVPGWYRAVFGTAFTFIASTGEWSWQTSQLDCAVDLATCVP